MLYVIFLLLLDCWFGFLALYYYCGKEYYGYSGGGYVVDYFVGALVYKGKIGFVWDYGCYVTAVLFRVCFDPVVAVFIYIPYFIAAITIFYKKMTCNSILLACVRA